MLGAVLIDAGGTLWPDVWPASAADDDARVERVRAALPHLSDAGAEVLVAALSPLVHPPTDQQQTRPLVAAQLALLGETDAAAVDAVVDAMLLPAKGRVAPFEGAHELLGGLFARGVRVVVVSNVMWRDARAHRSDFQDLGLDAFVDAYVTSLDVGWRKPDARFFVAALRAARHDPRDCTMVGDSECNDIEPAAALGMRTIRVSLHRPLPTDSAADAVCGSLAHVAAILLE